MTAQHRGRPRPNLAPWPNRLFAWLGDTAPCLRRSLSRYWYDLLAGRYPQTDWTFMNYGFAAIDAAAPLLPLDAADEENRYPIQLYHHVAGSVRLRGAHVLEVGCGRGGGASYLARYLEPASVLGIDLSARAIAFCQRAHPVPHLTFQQGDAEALPSRAGAFDVVVNVESSHCYGSVPAFLGEVRRVLRPGGYFLWADLRPEEQVAETRWQFEQAGFRRCEERDITPYVVCALERMTDKRREFIRRLVPRLLVPSVEEFAGVPGTRMYEALRAGAIQYLSGVLQKPPARAKISLQSSHVYRHSHPAARPISTLRAVTSRWA